MLKKNVWQVASVLAVGIAIVAGLTSILLSYEKLPSNPYPPKNLDEIYTHDLDSLLGSDGKRIYTVTLLSQEESVVYRTIDERDVQAYKVPYPELDVAATGGCRLMAHSVADGGLSVVQLNDGTHAFDGNVDLGEIPVGALYFTYYAKGATLGFPAFSPSGEYLSAVATYTMYGRPQVSIVVMSALTVSDIDEILRLDQWLNPEFAPRDLRWSNDSQAIAWRQATADGTGYVFYAVTRDGVVTPISSDVYQTYEDVLTHYTPEAHEFLCAARG